LNFEPLRRKFCGVLLKVLKRYPKRKRKKMLSLKAEQELHDLKPYDEIQFSTMKNGYQFIETAGHGYLFVPVGDKHMKEAWDVYKKSGYGFEGQLGVYLEEDCEMPAFLKAIV